MMIVLKISGQSLLPTWTKSFEDKIEWQRISSLGVLIVHHSDKLVGLNPEDGTVRWEIKLSGTFSEHSYSELERTEFFILNNLQGEILIVNGLNGEVALSNKSNGFTKLVDHYMLSSLNKLMLIVEMSGSSGSSLLCYDILQESILWSNDKVFKISGLSLGNSKLGSLLSAAATEYVNESNVSPLLSKPILLPGNDVLLLHKANAIAIDPITGVEKWKLPLGDAKRAIAKIYTTPENRWVFIGSEIATQSAASSGPPSSNFILQGVNIDTGTPLWKSPFRAKGGLSTLNFHQDGIVITPVGAKPQINLIDLQAGNGKFGKKGKGEKFKGSIVRHFELDNNWLVIMTFDNAWNNKGEEYFVNLLNPSTGLLLHEKSEKLKGDLKSIRLLDAKSALYATNKEINILDLAKGENLIESIESSSPLDPSKYDSRKHSVPFAESGEFLYAYSSKTQQLYKVDLTKKTSSTLGSKIKFEGKEHPYLIECLEEGVLLTSEQNMLLIGYNGQTIFQTYFPAPRNPAFLRAIATAQGIRAAYIGAASAMVSASLENAAKQSDNEFERSFAQGLSEGYSNISDQGFAYSKDAMNYANQRFKASAITPNYVFMITELEKKQIALIQVSKNDGKVLQKIDLNKDKNPVYEIDQITSRLYYKSASNTIEAYSFE